MKQYKAKILPDWFSAVNIGETVPLILEHNIYGEKIGDIKIIGKNHGLIFSDKVKLGDKLSAGSFVENNGAHVVREVSLVKHPRYKDCEVLHEVTE